MDTPPNRRSSANRDGRTNPEIATDLGISLAGAKWHVSEVLSKLGVLSREDVAAYWRWRTNRRVRAKRWLGGAAVLAFGKAGAAALAVVVIATAAVSVVVILAQDDGSGVGALDSETPAANPSAQPTTVAATATTEPTEAPATPTTPSFKAPIDWVNVVRFDGITYIGGGAIGRTIQIDAVDLGPQFTEVEFNISQNVNDPSYRIKDGDATFLDAGTPVYVVRGYSPEFRLAAPVDGQFVVYEADTNPAATRGGELLDIGGRVAYIGVNSPTDGRTELAAIIDPGTVARLVDLVLGAPVEQADHMNDGTPHFVAFHLNDGTEVVRAFSPVSGELSRGIMLPPEFAAAIEQALADR